MHRVKPKIYLFAETAINNEGLQEYLNDIGAPEWKTDAHSDGEKLIEVMGRVCYRSFKPGLNPNVMKVREGSKAYIANVIKVKHGSLFAHAHVSILFHNVSRVFTHELVRHAIGTAISQESLRYVRLTDLGLWLPSCIKEDDEMVHLFEHTFESLEILQLKMSAHFRLDEPGMNFDKKKEVTSAMRRIAPIGLATSIGFTMSHRALRHILCQRTSRHAEEEIRLVFAMVGKMAMKKWPEIYADFTTEEVKGILEFSTPNEKI